MSKADTRSIVLVTGGAGFLGSHICDRYKDKYRVVVVDNFMTGRRENVPAGCEVISIDVTSNLFLEEMRMLYYKHDISRIFNFACPASPPKYQLDPVHTMMTSVVGTNNTLKLARDFGSIFVQASTSEVYGDPEVSPQVESYRGCVNTIGPRACYDEGKRAAEALCYDYARMGVNVRVARIFNTYGPRMDVDDGRVVTNFVKQALLGDDITIYGDGSQTRSFCYVRDLIDGIVGLSETLNPPQHPVNIGNPTEFTVLELADKVLELLPESESKIIMCDLPIDDPKQRKPDTRCAEKYLGWKAGIKLGWGLSMMIDYVRDELKRMGRL